ncbi:class I adenylate-forming enzyme family protein [Paraburkholderia diazotrophica]|uniref:Long-chain acyl-CoA synthetase/malonyl-CoA/methylmalonyl-CoA synthetase n=1 Tax=Paraburkholderia diazotrophica TaxID=667676 RepID=A0A1H7C5I7_9BURK|nr:class I adenylate-forming enzyme family protein [Paraburkholderia diazotrophica]SEJ84878.1 long-chain acyl-CoA synthetase/malonyl-CoA/methylmalonyl-CoA synthetase [Paraburkholderia diazotrophica]
MSTRARHPVAEPTWRSVTALIEQHRRETPNKPAIVDVDRRVSMTFEQLANCVDAIARQFARRGIAKGARIVLADCEAPDKLLLWLGAWRLGAIVCPLDVLFVGNETARKLLDTIQPKLVVIPEDAPDSAAAGVNASVVRFTSWAFGDRMNANPGRDAIALAAEPDVQHDDAQPLPDGATISEPSDIASMCATSGTTGVPKIVVYDHGCYWLNGLDSIDLLGLNRDDRMLEYRSFDWYSAQILSFIPFLQLGSTLCIARRFSRSRFVDWIRDHRITVCAGVPTVLNMLLEAPLDVPAGTFASLRAMTCSTAPLSPVQWRRFEQLYGIRILNLYGSSEAGWMCGNRLHRRKVGTVGYPAAHITFDIVDPEGVSCAPDVEGQVVVDGAKLALGMLQQDGSLLPIRGTPLFTRDIAARDAQGFVRMAARMDDLIIRGGVKIVPQEIEEVMRSHPQIQDVAALGVPDPLYGQETVCFVVPQPGTAPDTEALLAHCREHLAREKVPKDIFSIQSLPRSARGKILRDALRQQWWQIVNSRRNMSERQCE